MNQKYVDTFEVLLKGTERPGMDKLIEAIKKSDFYEAPASTRFHGAAPGCLLEHSLNVYNRLFEKMTTSPFWMEVAEKHNYKVENYVISALLHDLCKMYFYSIEYKNQKVYSETGSKKDEKGRFDWQTVPCYVVDDKFPYGHGEKSVMLAEQFIKLEPVERYAIRWHMGAYSGQQDWNTLGAAMEKYPLVLALHEADMEACRVMEVEA